MTKRRRLTVAVRRGLRLMRALAVVDRDSASGLWGDDGDRDPETLRERADVERAIAWIDSLREGGQ